MELKLGSTRLDPAASLASAGLQAHDMVVVSREAPSQTSASMNNAAPAVLDDASLRQQAVAIQLQIRGNPLMLQQLQQVLEDIVTFKACS